MAINLRAGYANYKNMNTSSILAVCQLVKDNTGGKTIKLTYSGEGDSGNITSVEVTSGKLVLELDNTICEQVVSVGYTLLRNYKRSWEINEGSFGNILIDMEEGKVDINHTNYVTEYVESTCKVSISKFLPKKKDRELFWSFFTPEYTLGKEVVQISADRDGAPEFKHDQYQEPFNVISKAKFQDGPSATLAKKTIIRILNHLEQQSEEITQTTLCFNTSSQQVEAQIEGVKASTAEDPTTLKVKELKEWIKMTKIAIKNDAPNTHVETEVKLG